MDPDSPELDHELMQYESVISAALTSTRVTRDTPVPLNMSKTQRLTLKRMGEGAKSGEARHVYLTADKDTAFVAVTPQQYQTMWLSHTSTAAYTEVDYFQVDWNSYRREAVKLAKEAKDSNLITDSEYRFITKDCTGPIRVPVGNLLVKTHKQINLYAQHPVPVAPSRAYIDTVNYVTTAWARFLSVKLTPAREQIKNRITDTADLIQKLSKHRFSQDCWIVTADVVDFYPSTEVSDGNNVIKQHIPAQLVELCLKVAELIHESIKVLTPVGCFSMAKNYSIGLSHSGEVCDLDWSRIEQRIFALLAERGLLATWWGRMVDDYLIILEGPIEHRLAILDALKKADPKRPLTVQISTQSVDFLDVTVFKGPHFLETGILDTKPYTKPSYTGMHLPFLSHHPMSTFDSILTGYQNRSVISSSSRISHMHCMVQKMKSFSGRGYPYKFLKQRLLQETCWKQTAFKRERKRRLQKVRTIKSTRIIPLRLKYTPRSEALSRQLSVSNLQKSIHKINPALSRVSLGKLTFCHLKTRNLLDTMRPTGFLPEVRIDDDNELWQD